MAQTREETLEERRRLRGEYVGLVDQVQALLFRHDPMGINFDFNTDEYDPEVGTILPPGFQATHPLKTFAGLCIRSSSVGLERISPATGSDI
jgi:hypothetical protein